MFDLGFVASAIFVWVILAIVFAVVEAFTMGILTIWFAIGAVAAAIAAYMGVGVPGQFFLFLGVSVALLYFTKPIARKLKIGKEKTNVDAVLGEKAVVTEMIGPNQVGQVRIRGLVWSAQAEQEGDAMEPGEEVIVKRVEGVRLLVRREEKQA